MTHHQGRTWTKKKARHFFYPDQPTTTSLQTLRHPRPIDIHTNTLTLNNTPQPLLDPGQPPRPYIVRMLRPDDKKRIIQLVSKKKQLSWKGKPFWVQQDFPREIREKWKEYNNIRKALKMEKSVRYGILPPARLIVTIQGETSIYKNAVEAAEDLKKKLPKTFEDWPQA